MKKLILLTIIGIFLFVTPVISFSEEVEGIDIIKKGIWTRKKIGRVKYKKSGGFFKNEVTNHKLLKETSRIPAIINTSFGVSYVIKGHPRGEKVNITGIIEHPGMRNSKDGNVIYTQQFTLKKIIGEITYNTYTLDRDYEIVNGDWIFKFYYKNKMLAEAKFTLY